MKQILFLLSILFMFMFTGKAQSNFSVDSLMKHVYTLADDNFEGRSIGTKGGDKAAQYIVQQFETIGIKPLLSDYYHHFTYHEAALSAEGKNIIGVIEGSNPALKNEYIVLGGHYDHVGYKFIDGEKIVYNGADDNASGVSGIIELARAIYKNRDQFERSIVFVAFDGEETGLNGSKWFVNDSLIPASQIKLMMSIDMIGMLSTNKGVELYGMASMENLSDYAQQSASKVELPIKKEVSVVANRTDTKPFGDVGIPAVHVFTGTVSPYHKPEDDANLLDYDGMIKICDFIYDLTLTVANTKAVQIVSTLSTESKSKPIILAVRCNVGTSHHNYSNEFYRTKSGFAIQTGLYAHVRLSSRFVLQPEVLYETLGSTHADGNFRTHALTTPVNIMFRLAGNNEYNTWSYLAFGGYYTYNFAGKVGSNDIDFDTTYDANEYGLNFGLSLNISKVQIGVTQKIGLSNLYQDDALGNIKNSALFLSLGLQF